MHKDAVRPATSKPVDVRDAGVEGARRKSLGNPGSGCFGHFRYRVHAVAGQDFSFGAQPILFGVPGLAATLFVEFVGALPDFFLESFGVRGFHRYLPYE